jgi:uncharacterized membrane protein YdfJ with MMPL/SSD domain
MQRLDHTTIFVTIAVSYTPICLLVLAPFNDAIQPRAHKSRRKLEPSPTPQRRHAATAEVGGPAAQDRDLTPVLVGRAPYAISAILIVAFLLLLTCSSRSVSPARSHPPSSASPSRSRVLLDATVVGGMLVPATMALIGDRNSYLPKRLERVVPHVHFSH